MDFYEGVVIDYLRADRSLFLNTQCCIQLNAGKNPDTSGPHWYCDAVAVDFRNSCIFLCEISFSRRLDDLAKRLASWHESWPMLREALTRDCLLPPWPVRPWLFVPADLVGLLLSRLDKIRNGSALHFAPRITTLEMVEPWRYPSWNREGELPKPSSIPEEMKH